MESQLSAREVQVAAAICEFVCAYCGVSNEILFQPWQRARPYSRARHLAYRLLRHEGWSYPRIALAMKCHHTSVMWAIEVGKKGEPLPCVVIPEEGPAYPSKPKPLHSPRNPYDRYLARRLWRQAQAQRRIQ